jgi:hypothetical protein
MVKAGSLSRFLGWIMKHSAYNDPDKIMTNFGWKRRKDLEGK